MNDGSRTHFSQYFYPVSSAIVLMDSKKSSFGVKPDRAQAGSVMYKSYEEGVPVSIVLLIDRRVNKWDNGGITEHMYGDQVNQLNL